MTDTITTIDRIGCLITIVLLVAGPWACDLLKGKTKWPLKRGTTSKSNSKITTGETKTASSSLRPSTRSTAYEEMMGRLTERLN